MPKSLFSLSLILFLSVSFTQTKTQSGHTFKINELIKLVNSDSRQQIESFLASKNYKIDNSFKDNTDDRYSYINYKASNKKDYYTLQTYNNNVFGIKYVTNSPNIYSNALKTIRYLGFQIYFTDTSKGGISEFYRKDGIKLIFTKYESTKDYEIIVQND